MTHAAVIHKTGGPEVFAWEEVQVPEPGKGEVLIRQTAIGLNYIDTYQRSGLYPLPSMPAVLGMEAAGVIEKVGVGVAFLKPGDRVCYVGALGAYAERRVLPQAKLVKLPDQIPDAIAAAIMLKALTARFLVKYTYMVNPNTTALIHAAAGGVGTLLTQWAKHLGAKVIATVGSDEKKAIASKLGADFVINYRSEDVAAKVMEITSGKGANVAYDAVGKDTFQSTIDSLHELGLFVSYGQASGPIPPVDLSVFRPKSLYFTRPQLFTFIKDEAEYLASCMDVFDMLIGGHMKPEIGQTYYLKDVARAHADLEARRTKGSTVLVVSEEVLRG